jgi:hypothetical protein
VSVISLRKFRARWRTHIFARAIFFIGLFVMSDTPDQLRRLIASYRERLSTGGGFQTITFCLRGIEDAERRLDEIEAQERRRNSAAEPGGTGG